VRIRGVLAAVLVAVAVLSAVAPAQVLTPSRAPLDSLPRPKTPFPPVGNYPRACLDCHGWSFDPGFIIKDANARVLAVIAPDDTSAS
jgi:hypothetical protein